MKAELESKLSATLLRLRMNSPFFATLSLFAPVCFSRVIETAATDGTRVLLNPEFFGSLPAVERDGVFLHEVLHAALLHVPRCGSRQAERWNVAADIVVNGMIAELKFVSLPNGAIRDPKLQQLSVEEIYSLLPSRKIAMPAFGWDLQPPNSEASVQLQGDTESVSFGSIKDTGEDYWQSALAQAAVVARNQDMGKLPASLQRLISEVTAPQLDWRTELWRFLVHTPCDFEGYDRRFIGRGLYLEAVGGESVEVDVCIDTSGSIDSEALATFASELRGILDAYPKIGCQLYYADAECYGPYEMDRNSKLPAPKGGGGTSFCPFFEAVGKNQLAQPSTQRLAIYLTDGFGEFPRHQPWIQTLWVVTAGGLASDDFPFGTVTRLLK